MRTISRFALVMTACLLPAAGALAQWLPPEQQIAAAVSAAPQDLREGATVLGYTADGLVTLREGTNDLICLADEPNDERFHVACYHSSLEPFMARGRALRAENRSRNEVNETRETEARSGKLQMPDRPAALYSLTGPKDGFDYDAGTARDATPLYVVYIPYATAEMTGLSPSPAPGQPWIMDAGKPWAHIMIIPPKPDGDR